MTQNDFFFYWKTSALLWKEKIEKEFHGEDLLVPLFWGAHSTSGEDYDFAQEKPETDLLKLAEIAQECGKNIIFLLPLGPCPFFPLGGMPKLLARSPMLNQLGLPIVFVDEEQRMNKVFSFFTPKVFQSFQVFLLKIKETLDRHPQNLSLQGLKSYYFDITSEQELKSYSLLDDYSAAAEQRLSRFQSEKEQPRADFINSTLELLEETSKHTLENFWEGTLSCSFFNVSLENLVRECVGDTFGLESGVSFLESSFQSNFFPVSSQAMKNEKFFDSVIEKVWDKKMKFQQSSTHFGYDEEEDQQGLTQFFVFSTLESCLDDHLSTYLKKNYRGAFEVTQFGYAPKGENLLLPTSQEDMVTWGLQQFLQGKNVVLWRQNWSEPLKRKFERFILENSLDETHLVKTANYQIFSLGASRLICVSEKNDTQDDSHHKIWHEVTHLLEAENWFLEGDKVPCTWQRRPPQKQELSYEEVRVVTFLNPSSKKKSFIFYPGKEAALINIPFYEKSKIETKKGQIHIQMAPSSCTQLALGVVSS